jgi:cytochrome c-type biogenesis protein CcmF
VVHIGVVIIAVALAASSSYDREQELTLAVGDTGSVAGHELTYVGNRTIEADNKTSVRAQIRVDGQGFEPAINRFRGTEQSIGTPSVSTGLRQDVFLSLVRAPEGDEGQTIGLLVVVQPLVSWLWIGGLVMLMGTLLAAFPGRRRNPIDPVSAPVTVAGTPAEAPPPREPEPEPEPVEVGS